jgi:hypothetical protein
MALTVSSQAITAGQFASFTDVMFKTAGNFYGGAIAVLKNDESGFFDFTTLMPATGGTVGIVASPIAAVRSAALESNHVFKGAAGNLFDAYCLATVTGFFMLFDATSAPADGAVTPLGVVPVAAGQAVSFAYPATSPLSFSTGLVGVFSTTGPFTKAASATAFLSARVQ